MVNLATSLIVTPTGFWSNIISIFESFTFNYVLAIVLITICVKLLLSPLDFLNKKVSRDNARMQSVIAPQMEKLQKQYGHDKNLLNQKQMELYKSNGFSMGGSCAVMLTYMIISIVIFFTLFSALNTISHFRVEQQYIEVQSAYTQTINNSGTKEDAQNSALAKYDEKSNSFLWVKNIWLADNPWTNSVMSFKDFRGHLGDSVNMKTYSGFEEYKTTIEGFEAIIKTDSNGEQNISLKDFQNLDVVKSNSQIYNDFLTNFEQEYNDVMDKIKTERGGVNGYLITAILAMSTAFVSQWLMQRKTKVKQANNGTGIASPGGSKALMLILPIIMGVFTLLYNAVFGMYIIANQLVALITFPIIDKLLDKHYEKKDKERDEKIKVDYRRK